MQTNVHKMTQLGEVVAAVFDEALQYSADPREVSCLAAAAVTRMLQRARTSHAPGQQPSLDGGSS